MSFGKHFRWRPGVNIPDEDLFSTRTLAAVSSHLTDVYRILDAAANRTREGLRVIEDAVRFQGNNAFLSRRIKSHRHDLADILKPLPVELFVAARDTQGDVGTSISTPSEGQRVTSTDVVVAAMKRCQEAVRSLEEYSKIIDPTAAARFEQLRYQLYTTEKSIAGTESANQRLTQATIYLLLTSSSCQTGIESVVKASLEAGVRLFQLREKSMEDRELLSLARKVRHWTAEAGALLIINDRPDLAVLSDADGVHVGQTELSVQDARRIMGSHRLVGGSTHSLEQAQAAELDGGDYLGVGPTFPSVTKSFDQFMGLNLIHQVASEISRPWYAIGGIHLDNVKDVIAAGATRVAVSHVICGSNDPASDAARLVSSFKPGSNVDASATETSDAK